MDIMKTFCIAGPIDPQKHYYIPKRLSSDIEAHLLIFDRDPCKTWEEKISDEAVTFNGRAIHV